jgi:hypothetical protein
MPSPGRHAWPVPGQILKKKAQAQHAGFNVPSHRTLSVLKIQKQLATISEGFFAEFFSEI